MWRTPAFLLAVSGLLLCTVLKANGGEAAELAKLIDEKIQTRIDAEGLERVGPADDAEFLRRVHLDLHGVIPSAELTARFLDSSNPQKRAELIDELLASPRYGEHFADLWRARLISPQANEQRQQVERFSAWLANKFNSDSWDKIVYDLLTATGKMEENPAVTYLIEGRNPLSVTDLTDLSTRYFLGVRLNCAQCHDHPFVAWKREDYWGMAAFFAQIQTPGRPKMVYVAGVQDNPKLTLSTLKDADMIEGYQSRMPKFLGGEEWKSGTETTHREALAHWITSPENPYFARAAVNRTWWHFFGRGIVNPVDDMHSANQPSHPELLDELSKRFVESGFDLKQLCRAVLLSRTYQQTSRPGKGGDAEGRLFACMPIKVLTAEQLFDSLVSVLGPPGKSGNLDVRLGARDEFCRYFGADGDADPVRYERGIPHLLRLMNSPQFAGRNIVDLVSRVAPSNRPQDEVLDELYLSILSRRPTGAERKLMEDQLRSADGPQSAYRELVWALLLSSEFSLNH